MEIKKCLWREKSGNLIVCVLCCTEEPNGLMCDTVKYNEYDK